jgi:fructose-bisphosphate aldolase class II
MSLISLRQLLDHAAENNYGIPAFNINNLEQVRAIMEGAKELNSPVILQASKAARKYAGPIFVKKMVEAAMEEFSEIPTVLHQDHGGSPEDCKNCIELGFTSVMMDGSLKEDQKTPSDFEYNVRVTKKTVDIAHSSGVSVEGEIGCLGSLETGTGEKEDGVGAEGVLSHDQLLTDPDEASNFVDQTNVDALAIAIGTSHGAYKFSKPPTGETLAMDRIKEIHARLPNTHLVMHGSSFPQEIISEINKFGGQIKETYGVPVSEIKEGIKNGVRKVNVDTDLRLASTAAIRKFFFENPSEFDPRKYLLLSKDAMKDVVKNRLEEFGAAGNASKIKPSSLSIMASRYQSGELSSIIN